MSLEEMCGEGNGIVSSMGPFKYFLGKGWTTLIHCDPSLHTRSLRTVSPALMSDCADFILKAESFSFNRWLVGRMVKITGTHDFTADYWYI